MLNLFNIIIFCGLLRGITGNPSNFQPQSKNDLVSTRVQSDSYCVDLAKCVLNHFTRVQEQIDANDEMKRKINQLEKELERAKVELETRNILLNARDELIKELRILNRKNFLMLEETKHQLQQNNNMTNAGLHFDGIHRIKIENPAQFKVNYILDTSDWIVIQRRVDGCEDFHRDWEDYKEGFGHIRGEFFIGLEKLHSMTKSIPHELYIQMRDVNGENKYAYYDNFNVASEDENYKLKSVGTYKGTAGDSLSNHVGYMFTTRDRDNDNYRVNCAGNEWGGWWYNKCGTSHLNGKYYEDGISKSSTGIAWGSWQNWNYTISLTYVQMMIRPAQPK